MSRAPYILVVDDEPKNVRLLEAHLLPQGYEVATAANGAEALRRVSERAVDLVLLDVMMPGLDGFEVTRRLRAEATTRLLPVVLITALRETEDRIKGIEAGCDDFISKPFEKDEVLARVKTSLRIGYYRSLLDEKEKFDTIIDRIADGILILDGQLRVTRANPQAGLFLGCDPAAPPSDLLAHLAQHFRIPAKGHLAQALRAAPLTFELERPETATAKSLILSVRASPVRDPLGDLSSVVLLVHDVTEERREVWLKQTFLDLISHKLRTPIAVIASDVALLLDGLLGPLSPKQQEIIQVISEKTEHLRALIDRLLNFVTVSAQTFHPASKPIDMCEEVQGVLERWAQEPKRCRVEWTLEGTAGLPLIPVHPAHLELILRNLLENAVKFNDRDPVQITVQAFARQGHVAIAVKDNGRGVPPEDRERIFQKFYQVERYFTGNVEGVGLGLALVQRLAGLYGGTVDLHSELGQGSMFTVTFRTAPSEASPFS